MSFFFDMGAGESIPIGVFGLTGSGKSAFTYAAQHGELFGETEPTSDMVMYSEFKKGEKQVRLIDIGGMYPRKETIDELCGVKGVVFMVDTNNKERLSEAAWELYILGRIVHKRIPILVVLNSKRSINATPFTELFTLFEKASLPPQLIIEKMKLPPLKSNTTSHGFIIDEDKLTAPMNEFHEGPWSVVPLDNMNSGDEAAKILDWILLNIPNDIDEPLD